MKKQINLIAVIFVLLSLPALAQSVDSSWHNKTLPDSTQKLQTASLTVVITDLNNDKGEVRIALCNSKENYESGNPFMKAAAKIRNNTATFTFEKVPFGTYAVKFYHDENMNGKLDRNLFGMPKEDYGFSNNATGNFGPASFEDAKFEINKTSLTITVSAQ